ncbi:MAG TPA: CHAD domain-containing protein [Gaiellaceae bacterium]|nr:CHAD domain-containing protein [Gaiellaceae bacterium]
MPAIDSLRDLLDRQRRSIERSEQGVRDGTDPEALHQFRVATRRSRALIRASRPLVRDQLAALDRELRWLGGLTGPARDLDVLIEHLRGLLQELEPDREGAEAIVGALEHERLRERETLLAAIETARYRDLLARFGETVPTLSASDGDASLTRLARRELERLQAAYDDLGPSPSDEDLHELRIRAKQARYAAELAATAAGRPLEELAAALSDVQDLVGAHQDAVVAEERVRELATEESRLAAGRIVEHERGIRREARAKLPNAMRRVERRAARAF